MERTDIGTLVVPNIRSSDAGTYFCVGTNTVGSSEAYIEVFVKRGEAKHQTNFTLTFFIGYNFNIVLSHWSGEIIPSGVTIQPSIASVIEGETLDLNCIVPGTSPASVKWERAGGLLSSNHQVYLRPLWSIFDLCVLISFCVISFWATCLIYEPYVCLQGAGDSAADPAGLSRWHWWIYLSGGDRPIPSPGFCLCVCDLQRLP